MIHRLLTRLCPVLLVASVAHAEPLPARFDLAAQVPWSADGLKETLSSGGGAMLLTATPKKRSRLMVSLALGPDGAIWLFTKDQLGQAGADGFTRVDLGAFGAGLHAVAPLADGAVLLGSKGQENVLARLGLDGAAAWRKTGALDPSGADPAALKGVLRRLAADGDAIYLYATRQAGAIGKVDAGSGDVAAAVTLADFRSPAAWITGGVLYRAQPAGSGKHTWVSRALDGDDKVVEPAEGLARALPGATPLPDGGALVAPRAALTRMGADGQPSGDLPLAGIVRDGSDLYVAFRSGGGLDVTRWTGGKPGASVRLDGVDAHARLAAGSADGFKVIAGRSSMKPGTLLEFDGAGKKTGETPLGGKNDLVLGFEGKVDPVRRVIGADGAIYLPGVDAAGAFVVRITLP